jgi:autotransporter-associated beta strand protein
LTINGDLVLTSLNLGGSLTLNSNGASQINGVIANASGAIGSLTKTSSGTLTLSGNNTYSGGTALEQGLIRLGSSTQVTNRLITAGPIGTGALDVKSGATLDLNGNTLANALVLSGQGQSNQGALINTSTSAATVLGDITLTADTTMATRGDLVFSSIDGTTGLGNSASLGIKTQPLSQWTSLTISSDSSDPYRLTLKTSPSLGLGPGDVVRFSKLVGGKLSEGFGVVTSVNDAAASELSIRTDFKIAGSSEFSIDKVDTTAPKLSLKSLESNASSRITIDRALALGGLTVDSQVALKVTGQQIATIGSQSFSGPVVIDNASIGGPCASTWLLECYFNEQIFSNPTVFSSLKGSIDFQSTLNSYTASPSNRSVLITHGNVAGVSTENPALRFSDSVGVQGEFGAFIAKAPSIAIGPTNSSLKAKAIELKVAPASGITAIPSVILNGQVTLEPTVSRLTITSEGGSLVTSGGFLSKAIDQELSISLASTTSGVNTAGTLWADKSWASPQLPFGQVTVTASKFSSYGSEFCSVLDPLNCSAKSQTVSVYTNKLHAKLESPTSVLRDEFLINKAAAEEAAAKAAAEAAAKKAAEEAAAKAAAEAAAKKAAEEAAAKAAAEAAAKKAAEEAAAKAAAEAAAKKAAEEAAAKAAAEAAAKKAAEEVTARAAVEASRVVQAATQAATSSVAAANNAVSAAARVPAVTPTPTPSTAVAATPTASTSASQSSTASALQDSSSSQGATPSSGSPQSSTNDASSTQGSTSPPSSSPSGSSTAGSGVQSPTPASPSTSAAASRTASSGQTSTPTAASASTLPAVPPSPPSPVPTSKPPTPKDNADASDRTLASVKSPQAPKPASQAQRVTTKLVAVSGMVVTQVSSPPALPPGSTLDQNVPALPNPGKW